MDAIVVRHSDIEVVKNMAKCAKIPIINAMTSDNHPCEIITDLYALSKIYKDFENYQITLRHMQKANLGAVLNLCPPFFRGEEVSEEVIKSDYFVGYEFKRHLIEVQQAILC